MDFVRCTRRGKTHYNANEFSKMKTDMEGKVVTYKAKLGEKVINKVNVLTMMKLVHQLLWLNPLRFS